MATGFRGVVFDVDGVLVDSPHERAWRDGLQQLMENEWSDIRDQTSYSPEAFTPQIYQREMSGMPRYKGAQAALEYFGVPDVERRAQEYGDRKQEMIVELIEQSEFYAYPDALRFVLECKNAGLKMVTASSSKNANAFLERIRLDEFCEQEGLSYDFVQEGYTILDILDANVSGRDFEQGKPHPTIFLTAAEEMGTSPEDTFVVEDAVNGVEAAKAGDMAALGLARADDEEMLADAGADLVVTSLDDVSVDALSEGRLKEVRRTVISRDTAALGEYGPAVEGALKELRDERVVERMWEGDHTAWGPEPEEIADRLGWLRSPQESEEALHEIQGLATALRDEGIEHILLLGMGGSSLAPETFGLSLDARKGYPDLAVLDSTDPEAVLRHADRLDLSRTVFVVSTKSGGTVETFSFFKYFYNRVVEVVGEERAGSHFVAITDPGSGLQDTAERYGFRATFLNNPNIGGRYSALSLFGIVPATLVGVDVPRLLSGGKTAASECGPEVKVEENPGAWQGAAMGELASNLGRDKLTLLASPALAAFGPWVEQLIAESTGKDGTGILPVAEEPEGTPDAYCDDRLFVSMKLHGEENPNGLVEELRGLGHPVIEVELADAYELGGEMFRWEVATAIAGWRLGINPFDQPNVESAKVQARKMVAEYQEKGELPEPEPTVEEDGISVYSSEDAASVDEALESFFAQARPGDYVALQAYLPPFDETTEVLQRMRARLMHRLGVATTSGYGPRFLHSTGQLHKGDGGNGLFVQITADHERDADIPDEAGAPESSLSFGVLIDAQALGDRQALLDAGRRVIRLHISRDVSGLNRLADSL